MTKDPSIFNDVIGPIMRGPSSSHTAASWRIAKTCLDILNEPLKSALIEFDKNGAWAPNFREQGTVMGINGGLLGLEITDSKMKDTELELKNRGILIDYSINTFPTDHPNTVRLSLLGEKDNKVQFTAVSLGGGSFEIQQIDGLDVEICGDYFELLIRYENNKSNIQDKIKAILPKKVILRKSSGTNFDLQEIKSSTKIPSAQFDFIKSLEGVISIVNINPVLPVISGNETEVSFTSLDSMLAYANKMGLDLGQLGLIYENSRSGLTESDLILKMNEIIEVIDNSIRTGLHGTNYKDRILQQQSHLINHSIKSGKIPHNPTINGIISNVTAIMESKSAMEVIVANPTAGSCGTIGGLFKTITEELESETNDIVKAYFAAGLIGIFFCGGPGFSAEEHGCQVECGAASGMAAAGIVQLYGGTAKQAVDAASMTIQNMIGLVCDPVADRVEIPCLGKNISAAVNALTCATMACSGYDAVIPLDEVLKTVSEVGEQMPSCVKCTGRGGLATTETAIKLKQQLTD